MDALLKRKNSFLLVISRFILGGMFVFAGIEKLFSLREFAQIVVNYRILTDWAAVQTAYFLPWLEVVLGGLLIAGVFVRKAAFAVAFLLIVFIGALTFKLISGRLGACGCFVSGVASGPGEIVFGLIRDFVLLLVAGSIFRNVGNPFPQGGRMFSREYTRTVAQEIVEKENI